MHIIRDMMKISMIDTAQSQQISNNSSTPQQVSNSTVGGKELENVPVTGEVPALKEVGHENPLPAEVAHVGVSYTPTTVHIPPKIAQMGVTAVGQASAPPAIVVSLPLTDDQIAQGLTQSITSSWRWMAEWCRRRLKQLHVGIKSIQGKVVRVKQ